MNNLESQHCARNTNIELLRLSLMLVIFLWHIIMHGYGFKNIGDDSFAPDNIGFITFCCALFSPATYCFMFISGWFGMKFSLKKTLFFVVSAFSCYILSVFGRYVLFGEFDIIGVLRGVFPITNSVWWFLTGYVLVFLCSPFINLGFEQLPLKTIKYILVVLTFMETVRLTRWGTNIGSDFLGLLYMYILARFLRKVNISISLKTLTIVFVFSLMLLWGSCWATSSLAPPFSRLSFSLLSYCNPLIILMATAIFLMVQRIKPRYFPWLNKASQGTLFIYLLTEGIMQDKGYIAVFHIFERNLLLGLMTTILIIIVCIFIGLAITSLISIIENSRFFKRLDAAYQAP